MKKINRSTSGSAFLFSVATAALTAGCGGGGGSAGFNATPVAITSANAPQIAAQAALVSGAMTTTGSSGGISATGASVHARPNDLNVLAMILAQVKRVGDVPIPPSPSHATVQMVMPQATIPCSQSGSYSVDALTATSATLIFTNCVDSATSGTLNGTISLSSIVATDLTTVPWSFSTHFTVTNFSSDDGVNVVVLNGSSDLTDQMAADGVTETFGMTGGPLSIAVDGNNGALSSFTYALTENSSLPSYSTSLDGTLDSNLLSGRVTLDTTVAFTGADINSNDPETGSMTIHGAANSSVKVTATGSGGVRLDVDADGDGVAEDTTNTLWSSLAVLL